MESVKVTLISVSYEKECCKGVDGTNIKKPEALSLVADDGGAFDFFSSKTTTTT